MMSEGKTIGQLMEEMRAKAGAQNYHGHGYMDLQRFAEDTRHMMEAAGVTEELKACDPMRWVGLMNTLTAQIEEILIRELICS